MATKGKPYDHICSVCGKSFFGYGKSRCPDCHRKYVAEGMARRREEERVKQISSNDELEKTGWKICTKCHKKRQLSEFRTRHEGRKGKINKICDRCLTEIYAGRADLSKFSPEYWRRKAYNANTCGRQRLGRLAGKPFKEFKLTDLAWICKPQDLVDLYNAQDGKCAYCGRKLDAGSLWIDHIVPLSRNGMHIKQNIALACKDCNCLKGARTKEEFLDFLKTYTEQVAKKLAEVSDKEPKR